jgi:imidazolonepropionase-like amidohydrolase
VTRERWRLPGVILPEGERRDLWAVDGKLSSAPVDGAKRLPGRYTLPGLVDAHAHLTLGPALRHLGTTGATEALRQLRDQGVLAVRDVGAPHSATLSMAPDPTLPLLQVAGRWLAPPGRFYPSLHEPVTSDALIEAALTEVAAGAHWVKVVADWTGPELSYQRGLLARLVEAVHAAGARVAAHTAEAGVRDIVAAGVDSIEHGWSLDRDSIETMARRGAALTPTLTALQSRLPDEAPPERRVRQGRWLESARSTVAQAAARGVTILAGTDTAGTVAEEIRALIDFGLSPVEALRSATTAARAFLGLAGLEDGADADVVTFEVDPREDPEALTNPAAILLRGVRVS